MFLQNHLADIVWKMLLVLCLEGLTFVVEYFVGWKIFFGHFTNEHYDVVQMNILHLFENPKYAK